MTNIKFQVFQHRQDGKVDFCKGWEEYANGFGNLKTEFWLGNNFEPNKS